MCSSYRLNVFQENMHLSGDEFTLTLDSKRNNFERVILIGFASVGTAIEHQKYLLEKEKIKQTLIPETVTIIVNIPVTRNNLIISVSASSILIEKFSTGRIDSKQFMQEIKDSIQTL